MIAYAFLLGSDYAEGVKGVGIVNATEIVEAFVKSDSVDKGSIQDKMFFGETESFLDLENPRALGEKKSGNSQILDQKQILNSSDYVTNGLINFKNWLDQYAASAVSSELGRELDTSSIKESVVR